MLPYSLQPPCCWHPRTGFPGALSAALCAWLRGGDARGVSAGGQVRALRVRTHPGRTGFGPWVTGSYLPRLGHVIVPCVPQFPLPPGCPWFHRAP